MAIAFAGMSSGGHISVEAFNPAIAIAVAVANIGDIKYEMLISIANNVE